MEAPRVDEEFSSGFELDSLVAFDSDVSSDETVWNVDATFAIEVGAGIRSEDEFNPLLPLADDGWLDAIPEQGLDQLEQLLDQELVNWRARKG
jgi:hypothetical protein